jgi:hypothetical protein
MEMSNASEWFIDAGGPKRGPYTIQQIDQFFKSGHVAPDTMLYNSRDPQNPTTVRALLELSSTALPGRPSVDLDKPIIAPGSEDAPPDPTLSLFLTLQSTKKKPAIDPNMDRTPGTTKGRFAETQLWFFGAMVMIVGTLVWGTTKLMNYSNELASVKTEQPEAKPVYHSAPPVAEHGTQPTAPSVPSKKNLSDYLPKTTPHVASPVSRTAHVPPSVGRGNDRERQRIRDREIEMEKERQRQKDLEYDRERDRDRDQDDRDLKKRDLGDPFENDAGVLQQAPIAVPPPPPSDPDAPIID